MLYRVARSNGFDKLRGKWLVVWSTREWNEQKKKMSAWTDNGIVENLAQVGEGGSSRWTMGVWRSNIWSCVTVPPSEVREASRKGEMGRSIKNVGLTDETKTCELDKHLETIQGV